METLADLLRRRRLTPDEALTLLTAIGLDQSRQADDDIHGAIRPGNVLVREQPGGLTFKLTLEDDSDDPDRVAPEQQRGGPVDARTDVYLTGLLLFEALTGHRPPRGAPLNARAYGISPALEAVIARALSEDPRYRFRRVPEMSLAAVEAVHNPVPTVPPGPAPAYAPGPAPPRRSACREARGRPAAPAMPTVERSQPVFP